MVSVELVPKKREFVRTYWEHTQDPELRSLFPFEDITLPEAFDQFERISQDEKSSFGRSILCEGRDVGDVWIYSIDYQEESAFLSIVVFDKNVWGSGVGSKTVKNFLELAFERFSIKLIRAITYKSNVRSIRCLTRAGFQESESFEENGVRSALLTLTGR